MRAVVQRVSEASVTVAATVVGSIGPGLLVLLGVAQADEATDAQWLARKLVERLPQGYLTPLPDGTTYGEALLAPTVLYSPVTEALHAAGITPHYCANITGHGWRKLLRHPAQLTYRLHSVPPVTPVLRFIQQHARQDDTEAYSTLNMGAGFALFVAAGDAERDVGAEQDVEGQHLGLGQQEELARAEELHGRRQLQERHDDLDRVQPGAALG